MKTAIAGASGRAGSCITVELARRAHQVTGIARNPENIAPAFPASPRSRATPATVLRLRNCGLATMPP